MPNRIRINLAHARELVEVPGIGEAEAERIVRFRSEHGPITDARQLGAVLGGRPITAPMLEHVDFAPADSTAPEAPGA